MAETGVAEPRGREDGCGEDGGGGDASTGRAHLSVVAHSYGSTTAALAAHDHGLDADELVLLGSPGAGRAVDDVTDTGLGAGHVWVGAHSRDPVTWLGNHGAWHLEALEGLGLGDDPAEDDFGARRLRAESEGDPHTSYLDPVARRWATSPWSSPATASRPCSPSLATTRGGARCSTPSGPAPTARRPGLRGRDGA